jgi:DNA-binding transcriptional regulator YhcF (GntR family)
VQAPIPAIAGVTVFEVSQSVRGRLMRIRIDRESDVPLREQIAAQLVFLIGVGQLKPGDDLPSVRQLARMLQVHHNTVSQAYREPLLAGFLERAPGRRLTVGTQRSGTPRSGSDMDGIIDDAIARAHACGYSPHDLKRRLEDRLRAIPPDRVLVVSKRPGLRVLTSVELRQCLSVVVDACSPEELAFDPGRAADALVLSSPGAFPKVRQLLPPEQSIVRIRYATPDEELARIGSLEQPSVIAVASISRYFLEIARDVLASAVGDRHALVEVLMTRSRRRIPRAADLVICDSVAYRVLSPDQRGGRLIRHRLLSADCLDEIGTRIAGDATRRSPA